MTVMSDSRAQTSDLATSAEAISTALAPRIEQLISDLAAIHSHDGGERLRAALGLDSRKAWTRFDDEAKERFLLAYGICGRLGDSALAAGVCYRTVRRHLDEDEDFAELASVAIECYRDQVRKAIHEEGVEGRLEPVIAHDAEGNPQVVDYIRKRNPKILELAAKLNLPEYREASGLQVNIDARTGVLIAPSVSSPDDWEQRFGGKVLPPQGEGLPGIVSSRILESEQNGGLRR